MICVFFSLSLSLSNDRNGQRRPAVSGRLRVDRAAFFVVVFVVVTVPTTFDIRSNDRQLFRPALLIDKLLLTASLPPCFSFLFFFFVSPLRPLRTGFLSNGNQTKPFLRQMRRNACSTIFFLYNTDTNLMQTVLSLCTYLSERVFAGLHSSDSLPWPPPLFFTVAL